MCVAHVQDPKRNDDYYGSSSRATEELDRAIALSLTEEELKHKSTGLISIRGFSLLIGLQVKHEFFHFKSQRIMTKCTLKSQDPVQY